MNNDNNEVVERRLKALEFWSRHGLSATLDAFGHSRRSLYGWRSAYRSAGLSGLRPKSRAPVRRRSRRWPPALVAEIRCLRRRWPNLGKDQLHVLLKPWCAERELPCPSASTIGRLIAEAPDKMRVSPVRLTPKGKSKPYRRRVKSNRRPKGYRPVVPGELAGLDAIERRMGDLKRYLLTFIDEASGFAAALAVPRLDAAHAAHFMACCRKLAPFDVRATITDNGSAFQAGFADYLKKNQIMAYKTWPRTPKMNAKCERFNRTVQEQFVDFHEELLFDDIKAFNQKLADRLVAYNAWRPHKGHRLQTPMQVIINHFKQHQNKRQLCNLGWTHTEILQYENHQVSCSTDLALNS